MGYFFKLFCLAAVFVALCAKGGELCNTSGSLFPTDNVLSAVNGYCLAETEDTTAHAPNVDYHGLSPRPDLAGRIPLLQRMSGKSSTNVNPESWFFKVGKAASGRVKDGI
ncbi:hypothetical protein [Desulfovibrio inopinatus]|uniref:hypothetical protein n=1 Tax=Desulfovibrio inopinatus TaxID=102109 RepID=UPI0003FD7B0F|nr:hypothetical protein [Desulfovibrio inopinatus]